MAYRANLLVCAGTGCVSNRSFRVKTALEAEIVKRGLADEIQVVATGCNGFCERGPVVVHQPDGIFYQRVSENDVPLLVAEHCLKGRPVRKLMYVPPESKTPIPKLGEIGFFKHQRLMVLRHRGLIDPEKIDDYIAVDGYTALVKALTEMTPEEIVEEVEASGLRGRGGAGFPTGLKWKICRKAPGEKKYLICNGDEGDPGAFMDRCVLEADPHAVLEGMAIGAKAIGAAEGIVYVRDEYPLALKRVTLAIQAAEEYGLLGDDILGTGFSFRMSVVRGGGAFVCGEETALIASIEGRPGRPRARPPFPAQKGLWGCPTNINNVETWANVPVIIQRGASWYASIGTEKSKGTKVFALVGKVANTGLVEVPMGIPLRTIVYDIGGGVPDGRELKAVQTGGPSGGCIPKELIDVPVDYEALAEAGSIMGSGGLIVLDDGTCMVDLAKYFVAFTMDESCGKCTSCRNGTRLMHRILERITRGEGHAGDIETLLELGEGVKALSLCGLGQTAPNPVLSTIRYFRNEYERHIVDMRCDAFVCKELVGAPCQAACPLGTAAWRYTAHIQRGEYDEAYRVIREPNPFPSVCARACHHPCERWCRSGTTGNRPIAIRALKRFVTDRFDPSAYRPRRSSVGRGRRVAVVGAGPAGLTAAHYLSLEGYRVTIFEAEAEPGGMLVIGIPAYRLPRDVLRKEIAALIDENVTLRCGTALGRDVTIDSLFAEGYEAIFLATGAHRSKRLELQGEDVPGIHASVPFLKAFNLRAESLAHGRVGVIGGGNSAVDAARVALRQKGVESVTVFYRRTEHEMPAFREEIDAALAEGVALEVLVSPVQVLSAGGRLSGVEFRRNELGDWDASGRRRPVPVRGSEFTIPLDTLIVAISEEPDTAAIAGMGIEVGKWGEVRVDPETLATSRKGVFAGGDGVTGPLTLAEAIAAGKKAALVIDRYLRGEELKGPGRAALPEVFIEPPAPEDQEAAGIARAVPPAVPAEARKTSFVEVEMALAEGEARREALRCLRCDLDFTRNERKLAVAARRTT